MKVFISYPHDSPSSKKLMVQLADRLNDCGITTWTGVSPEKTADPEAAVQQNHRALQSSDKVLLLVDTFYPKSKWEDRERRALLETAWSDPEKLIPVLIGDVEVPTFLRSAVRPGKPFTAIRLEDPKRDWGDVVDKLVKVFNEHAALSTVAKNFNSTKQDRAEQQERLSYVRETARHFDKP
jgi:hypothetical protein